VSALPPSLSRTLALLLPLAGAVLLYLLAVQPLLGDAAATRASIAERRAALARFDRVAAELPQRRARLAALHRRRAETAGFLQGGNDALLAAQLQSRVKALVDAAHGDLKSTQVLPVENEGPYRRIAVRAQMTLDLAAAQRVLYGVETGSPLLFLDNVDLRAHSENRWRGRAQAGADPDPLLDLRFDVYGYRRGGGPAAPRTMAANAPAQ
jgi:general secretion pathway protein M